MLPKIKNKLFLTPELAPIFASRDEDLLQILGTLTRVADGQGYESDTGSQGHREYAENIMFAWIGAAVEVPYKVHKGIEFAQVIINTKCVDISLLQLERRMIQKVATGTMSME
jgi:hypothetical protein